MSKFTKDIETYKNAKSKCKAELAGLLKEAKTVGDHLEQATSGIMATIAAQEKYETKLASDIESLKDSLMFLKSDSEALDDLTPLLAKVKAAKSEDDLQLIAKASKDSLGQGGIKWNKPLLPQKPALEQLLTKHIADITRRSETIVQDCGDRVNKWEKHKVKWEASLKSIVEISRKLEALKLG